MLVFLKMSDSQSDETVILNVLEIKFFFSLSNLFYLAVRYDFIVSLW